MKDLQIECILSIRRENKIVVFFFVSIVGKWIDDLSERFIFLIEIEFSLIGSASPIEIRHHSRLIDVMFARNNFVKKICQLVSVVCSFFEILFIRSHPSIYAMLWSMRIRLTIHMSSKKMRFFYTEESCFYWIPLLSMIICESK